MPAKYQKICLYCGKKSIGYGKKFCNRKCFEKWEIGDKNPSWKGGKSEWKKRQKIWRENNKERLLQKGREYYFKVDRFKFKKWRKCIQCNKDIFGTKKKKYCDDCRKIIIHKNLKGNQYWKLRKENPVGEKHHNWKGGLTFWKKKIWDSAKYRNWRKAIFQRDNYTCRKCGEKGFLEAHHTPIGFAELLRKYNIKTPEEALNCEELWKLDNGITLCRKCHDITKRKNNV